MSNTGLFPLNNCTQDTMFIARKLINFEILKRKYNLYRNILFGHLQQKREMYKHFYFVFFIRNL
jgi:hypothetical protein